MKPSTQGYRDNSPDKYSAMNLIPSNTISMKGVSQPITAIPVINGKPDYSKKKVLQPEQEDVYFEGAEAVLEVPFGQVGMTTSLLQNGFLPSFYEEQYYNQIKQQGTVGDGVITLTPEQLTNTPDFTQTTMPVLNAGMSASNMSGYYDANEIEELSDTNQAVVNDKNNQMMQYWANMMSGVGSTRDLSSSLTRAGYGFGFNADNYEWASPEAKKQAKIGNTLATVGAVGNTLIKGAKDFMSGMAAANREQQAVNEYHEEMAELMRNRKTTYYQKGGQVTDEMVLTGGYTTGLPNGAPMIPTAETESGEYIQNPDGTVQEVVGKRHSEGGELMNLEPGTKVISDYIKIGGELARKLSKDYDLNTSASNTFATVLDKFKKKIGLAELLDDYQSTVGKIKDQEEVDSTATKELNLSFLSKRVQELEEQKNPLDRQMEAFTNYLFDEQEALKTKEAESKVYKKGGLKLYQEGGTITPEQTEQILRQYSEVKGIPYEQLVQEFSELPPQQKEQALQQMVSEMQQQPDDQIGQLIQAYAQATQTDPNQIIQQLQQLPEQEQQQALQQMSNSLSSEQPQTEQFKKGGTAKNAWVSNKISILIKEGYPKDQAVAIAHSMWEKRKHQANPDGTIRTDDSYDYTLPNRTANYVLDINNLPTFALPNPSAVVDWQLQHRNPNNPLIYDDFDINQRLGWYNRNIPYLAERYFQTEEQGNIAPIAGSDTIYNFQRDYNGYIEDTAKLLKDRGESPEEVDKYVEQMMFLQDDQVNGNTARGFDNKLGQFTSTRGAFQLRVVTPEELQKLNESGIYTARQALNNTEKAKEILGEDTYNTVVQDLDKYQNADYTIADVVPLEEATITSNENTPTKTTTPYNGNQSNQRQQILPWAEINQSIPFPMGMEFGRLQSVSPINIQPVNISPEQQLNEISSQVDLANAQTNFAPDSTRASQIANILAIGTNASNQAIANTNLQNAQLNQQVEQYNENQVGAADRMNTELAENYTQRYLQTRAALESQQLGWYNYMNQLAAQQSQRRWNANIAASLFPNFRISSDGTVVALPGYVNEAYNSPTPQTDGSITTGIQTVKKGGCIKDYLESRMFNNHTNNTK